MKQFFILLVIFTTTCCTPKVNQMNKEEVDYPDNSFLRSAVKEPETVYSLYINNFPFQRLPENLRLLKNVKYFRIERSRKVDWEHAKTLINGLKTLRLLGFISNNFETVPFTGDSLTNLEALQLEGLKKVDLTLALKEASKLEKLRELAIFSVPYQQMPEEILQLKQLDEVKIGNYEGLDYDQHIGLFAQIPTLKALTIIKSDISELPQSFSQLNLEKLHFRKCPQLAYKTVLEKTTAFSGLETLEISGTSLESLPESIRKHGKLKRLILQENRELKLDKLSEDLVYLQTLEELDLTSSDPNPLDKPEKPRLIPENIRDLKNLKGLNLNNLRFLDLGHLIDVLKGLPHLEELSMDYISDYEEGSQFFKLPASFSSLKNLKKLSLNTTGYETFDNLTSLPEGITHLNKAEGGHETFPSIILTLKNLKSLDFKKNRLKAVPPEIGELQNIEYLDLSHNELEGLPDEISQLKKLKFLHLAENPFAEDETMQKKVKALLPNTVISFYE